jgi:UDP-N-acetylmuramoyl-tripeptide--D-alanyl-D-alanine ligase
VVGLIGGFTFIFNPTPLTGVGLIIGGLGVTLTLSTLLESWQLAQFYRQAQGRLQKISPVVIGVTASYGKTSIKHFLAQLLEGPFKVYPTPGSVNTLKGVLKDINTSLPEETQIYIVEMGAREPGDIREIVELVQPQYRILGRVGPQHLEYFKSLDRIIQTKLEIFGPPLFKKGVSYHRFQFPAPEKVEVIEGKIFNPQGDLGGIEWELELDQKRYRFKAPILGEFNIVNISLAVAIARDFLPVEELQKRVAQLKPIPHRLQKIEAGGKVIIDDSFNGNLEGVLGSFKLAQLHRGRRVIVTPGLVEVPEEFNRQIGEEINKIFQLAIITGRQNRALFEKVLKIPTIVVDSKEELERVLARETKPGDLILFSNDFPDYL